MKKVVLVDDKTPNMLLLKGLISSNCPNLEIIATADNPDDAYEHIMRYSPDIVFLDIEMPGADGFDLLSRFNPVFFEVIFTTAHSQYAARAFREQALDYLLKPIRVNDLLQAIRKAERQIALKQVDERLNQFLIKQDRSSQHAKIKLPACDGFILVDADEIVRCEASGSYTNVYFQGGKKMLISLHLKSCALLLPPHFFRVHYSHIVNLSFIYKYIKGRGGQVILVDGTELDVAANRKTDFLEALSKPLR